MAEFFASGWETALIVFSLHLLLVGVLVFKPSHMPKLLGLLVAIARLGYLIDGVGTLLSSTYDLDVATYTFIGELLLMVC